MPSNNGICHEWNFLSPRYSFWWAICPTKKGREGGMKGFYNIRGLEVTSEDIPGLLMVFPIPNDKSLIGDRKTIPYSYEGDYLEDL